jgi:hypothetical protein
MTAGICRAGNADLTTPALYNCVDIDAQLRYGVRLVFRGLAAVHK